MSVFVCLSVCLSVRISQKPFDFTRFLFLLPVGGRGSVVLCRRCDTICISGFVDDVFL